MRVVGLVALACAAALVSLAACDCSAAVGPPPLLLERTIPLPGVSGRIDHMAIDLDGRRLFVAELGNGSVEAIDLTTGRSLGRIGGLEEPQGLGYVRATGELAVATGGDGMLRFYRAADLKPVAALKLGEDADDVRVARRTGELFVAFGKALAVIDPVRHSIVRTVPLAAHPEGFQVEGDRAYVNLPGAAGIAVLDLAGGRQVAQWRNPGPQLNFPLAIGRDGRDLAVIYRLPPRLVIFRAATGQVEQGLAACGDADDLFFNRPGDRLYAICGSGAVDVFDRHGAGYAQARDVATRRGARTGLYVARLDRLFVAARAQNGHPAAILMFGPAPSRRSAHRWRGQRAPAAPR